MHGVGDDDEKSKARSKQSYESRPTENGESRELSLVETCSCNRRSRFPQFVR